MIKYFKRFNVLGSRVRFKMEFRVKKNFKLFYRFFKVGKLYFKDFGIY